MKIYLVMGDYEYESNHPLEVFVSKDNANKFIADAYAKCDPSLRSLPMGFDDLRLVEMDLKE